MISSLSPVKAQALTQKGKNQMRPEVPQPNFLDKVLQRMDSSGISSSGAVFNMCQPGVSNCKAAEMKALCQSCPDPSAVCKYLAGKVNKNMLTDVCKSTKGQSESSLWHHLRFGRVTASRLHGVAHCKTVSGALVESILGFKPFSGSSYEKGVALEGSVLRAVEKKLGVKIDATRLHILPARPMFAGSPGGLFTLGDVMHVAEVKCPASDKSVCRYADEGVLITPKVRAQLQLQMLATGAPCGLLCIADPHFERNGMVRVMHKLDEGCLQPIMDQAERFWRIAVLLMLL